MLLLLDNYDSFSHNLAHLIDVAAGAPVRVVRSDEIGVDEVLALEPRACILSPGPGRPRDRGIGVPLVRAALHHGLPLLGVCLGHQAIGEALGARLARAAVPVHGKVSAVRHTGAGVFRDLENPVSVMRYHSLHLEEASLPPELVVTARLTGASQDVMGIRHAHAKIEGIQFHPESFMTPTGRRMMQNFLEDLA